VTYRTLYGPTLGGKQIWVTECGAWTPDNKNVSAFDLNLRGVLAFATHLVQYVPHPYSQRERFSLLSAERNDAAVLEKARSFRRLSLTYAQRGRPIPWKFTDDVAGSGPVFVNALDMGSWWKVVLVNYSRDPQKISINVELPQSGSFKADRHGDGARVAKGTRSVVLNASPESLFQEVLQPGEAVEYLIHP